MIGVIFSFNKEITTETGVPIKKVFLAKDGGIRGIKYHGLRPIEAFIFNTEPGTLSGDEYLKENFISKDNLMEWLHHSISTSLHPMDGRIVYQDDELKKLFSI